MIRKLSRFYEREWEEDVEQAPRNNQRWWFSNFLSNFFYIIEVTWDVLKRHLMILMLGTKYICEDKVVSESNDLFMEDFVWNFLYLFSFGVQNFSFVTSQEFPFHTIFSFCVIKTRFFYLQNSYEKYDNLKWRIWTRILRQLANILIAHLPS